MGRSRSTGRARPGRLRGRPRTAPARTPESKLRSRRAAVTSTRAPTAQRDTRAGPAPLPPPRASRAPSPCPAEPGSLWPEPGPATPERQPELWRASRGARPPEDRGEGAHFTQSVSASLPSPERALERRALACFRRELPLALAPARAPGPPPPPPPPLPPPL